MDAFGIHRQLIDDYAAFTRSFVDIRDGRIAAVVDEAVEAGALWPDPWIRLDPNFEPGATPDALVESGALHQKCGKIFRIKKARADFGREMRLHRHQTEAIHADSKRNNYVLTTGTGSGRSLAYIVPIVDRVLRRGPGKGVRGLIVYPMNALANSQFGELEKFLQFGQFGYALIRADPLGTARVCCLWSTGRVERPPGSAEKRGCHEWSEGVPPIHHLDGNYRNCSGEMS